MYRFIESICCVDGKIQLLELHQERVNRTFTKYFPENKKINLFELINNVPKSGKYKCKVEYWKNEHFLEYIPYINPEIDSLQPVVNDHINYNFKSSDRAELVKLFERREKADDIMIIKNGLVTDSYFANLAFYNGKQWFTPEDALLNGVKRQYLLNEGLIQTKRILPQELSGFEKVSLINAMLDLDEVVITLK